MKSSTHQSTLHLSFKIKCCVDRLRPPSTADIYPLGCHVRFVPICDMVSSQPGGVFSDRFKLKLKLSSIFCTDATRTDRDAGARQSYPRAPENPEGCSYSGNRLFPSHVHDLLAASALRSG